jgi:hypothetical protein
MAADSVPACYLDAWARLQCQRPLLLAESDWWQAKIDAGLFLDTWGADAAALNWGAGELFDVPLHGKPGGLVWFIEGERIEAFGPSHARTDGGRLFRRARD